MPELLLEAKIIPRAHYCVVPFSYGHGIHFDYPLSMQGVLLLFHMGQINLKIKQRRFKFRFVDKNDLHCFFFNNLLSQPLIQRSKWQNTFIT